jgi:hypothetical protein
MFILTFIKTFYLDQVHLKEEHNVEPLLYKANNMYGDYVCQVSQHCAIVPRSILTSVRNPKPFSPIHHILGSELCNYGTGPRARSYLWASNS